MGTRKEDDYQETHMEPGTSAIGWRRGSSAGSAARDAVPLDELVGRRVRPVVVARLHSGVLECARSN